METLYDLLGALPRDDAEGLRAAFRKAVKGAHPDIRPGDPYAALKFREIVRANEILGDAEQRAAYDDLLELASVEQDQASKHAVAARIHKLASGVIALASAAIVTVGGYLLFMHVSAASVAPADNVDLAMRASSEIAAAISPAGSPETSDKAASPAKHQSDRTPGRANEASVPMAVVQKTRAESVLATAAGADFDLTAGEARFPRAKGISIDPNGDGSITGLDQANQTDPRFQPADADRGIIFLGLRKLHRAFADIASAKRIAKPSHPKPASTTAWKPRFDRTAFAPPPVPSFRRRSAAHDPSREESVAQLRVR